MPNVANITIEIDEKGAVQALGRVDAAGKQLDPTFDKVGKRGNVVLTDFSKNSERARESVTLLAQTTGIALPRALEKVISKTPALSGALNIAFSGAVVVAFAAQIIRLVNNFDSVGVAIEKAGTQWAIFGDRLRAALGLATTGAAQFQTILDQQKLLLPILDKERQLRQQAALAGLQGFAALREAHRQELEEIERLAQAQSVAALEQFGHTKNFADAEALIVTNKNIAILASEGKSAAERVALARSIADQTRQIQHEADVTGLSELDTLREKLRIDKQDLDVLVQRGQLTKQEAEDRKKALGAREAHEETVIENRRLVDIARARLESEASTSHGVTQIRAQLQTRLAEIDEQQRTSGHDLQELRVIAEREADQRIAELRAQNAEETRRMEEDAAISSLPPWRRADAQIAVSAQQRIREIQRQLDRGEIDSGDAARRMSAVWQQTFAQMRDSLANDLESLFDDITSGNIGKRFLQMFKHMVFQMIATWILGMQKMRAATQQTMGGGGGGGIWGILRDIFGGIFGGGAGGGGGSSQAGISQTPGVITNFGDFGSGEGVGFSSIGLGVPLSAGQGAARAGVSLPAGAGAGGPLADLFSKLFPHAMKGPWGQLLGVGGLGLLLDAFGRGGIRGGLEGALGGAMLGTQIFPGIGTVVGAFIGLLVGLFHKSTKKARLQIEANIKAGAQKIEDAYNLFQVDWSSARDNLEQLRQQGVDALKQAGVKDISRSRVGHVDQWINKAEKEIDITQAERNKREALIFGPAEFHRGGIVELGMSLRSPGIAGVPRLHSGGEVNANLLEGEGVVTRGGMQRIGRGGLDRINSGGGGDTHIHVNINALDSKSVVQWLDGGGMRQIVRGWRRAENEGWA